MEADLKSLQRRQYADEISRPRLFSKKEESNIDGNAPPASRPPTPTISGIKAASPKRCCGQNKPSLPVAVPREHWKPWAVELAAKAQPGDRGLGDVILREYGEYYQPKFNAWYMMTFRSKPGGLWGVAEVNARWPV